MEDDIERQNKLDQAHTALEKAIERRHQARLALQYCQKDVYEKLRLVLNASLSTDELSVIRKTVLEE